MRAITPEETTTTNHKWSTFNSNQLMHIPHIVCQPSYSNPMFTMNVSCHLPSITHKIYKGANMVIPIMQIISQPNQPVNLTHPQQILNWKKPVLLNWWELKIHQNASLTHPNSTQTCLPSSTYKTLQGPTKFPPTQIPTHTSMFPVSNNKKTTRTHP